MKKFTFIAVMIAVIAGLAFAQQPQAWVPGTEGNTWESPQSQATQGQFTSWADDFINPNFYNSLEINKWYGMVSFESTTKAAVGFATNVKEGLYLGAFYYGSFWARAATFDYSEGGTWLGNNKDSVLTYDGPIEFDDDITNQPYNQIAILIGFANMGFRLSFISTHQAFSIQEDSNIDNVVTTAYKSYSTDMGLISPQLAWGLTKDIVDGKGIRPYVTLDLDFNRDYTTSKPYTNSGGNWVVGDVRVTSNNSFVPKLGIGLGGFALAEKDGFALTADIDYALAIGIYNNEFNYTEDNKDKIDTINGTASGGDYIEMGYHTHLITPSIAGSWSGEKLSLGFLLSLNLGLQGANYTNNDLNYVGNEYKGLQKSGDEGTVSIVNFNPVLQLGAQWQITPKFALNAGGKIDLNAYSWVQSEGKSYDSDGKEIANSSFKQVRSAFGVEGAEIADIIDDPTSANTLFSSGSEIANELTVGVTLDATDNLGFEASCGVFADNALNVFYADVGGLFFFGKLLVTLKF